MFLLYNQKLKPRARELRKNQTKAEELLWEKIKGRQIKGYQFIRQRTIRFRQEQLEILGFKVLRFSNEEVEKNIKLVLTKITENM